MSRADAHRDDSRWIEAWEALDPMEGVDTVVLLAQARAERTDHLVHVTSRSPDDAQSPSDGGPTGLR